MEDQVEKVAEQYEQSNRHGSASLLLNVGAETSSNPAQIDGKLEDILHSLHKDGNRVSFDASSFRERLECSIEYQTANCEVIKLNVAYGHFTLFFVLINVDEISKLNHLRCVFSGAFGEIYEAYTNEGKTAVKRIEIKENQFEKTMETVLRELFLLNLASALGIGPKIINIYGFDIVIYRNTIEFSMEFCDGYNPNDFTKMSNDLRRKLELLHRCHIVHNDIKPENIAYSRFLSEYIFLDFGLSSIIKETNGEKTLTSFVGSMEYCSNQMRQLYLNAGKGFIDLYENDAFSLNKLILHFQHQSDKDTEILQNAQSKAFMGSSNRLYQCRQEIIFKYFLLVLSFTLSRKLYSDEEMSPKYPVNGEKILKFIRNLPYNEHIAPIYSKYCKKYDDERDQFEMEANSNRGFSRDVRTNKEDTTDSLFSERVYSLKWMSKSALEQEIDKKVLLVNTDRAKHLQPYMFRFIKLIKINGETDNFDEKINACKDYAHIRSLPTTNISHKPTFYKSVVYSIFDYIQQDFGRCKAEILKECIQTIIILEIVPQQRLIKAYKMVLGAGLSFVQTVGVCLEFLMGLQFTKNRFKSTYDYEQLTEVLVSELNSYLDNFHRQKQLKGDELVIFYRLKQVIVQKIDYLLKDGIKDVSSLPKDIKYNFSIFVNNECRKLLHNIQCYLINNQANIQLAKSSFINSYHLNYLSNEIIKRFNYLNMFTYHHFILYEYIYTKKHNLAFLYYRLFEKQLSPFQERKLYLIYMKNLLNRLRYEVKNNYRYSFIELQRPAYYIRMDPIFCVAQIKQLFEVLQLSASSSYFHTYIISLLQATAQMLSHPFYLSQFQSFIHRNANSILAFSGKSHKDSIYHHSSMLRNQITAIHNLIPVFIDLQLQNVLLNLPIFFQLGIEVISQSSCFMCKGFCFIELNILKCRHECSLGKQVASFNGLFQILILCLKNSQSLVQIGRIINQMFNMWYSYHILNQMYDFQHFLYLMIKEIKEYGFCFVQTKIPLIPIFYSLVSTYYDAIQLAEFIIGLTQTIQVQRSTQLIGHFYHDIHKIFTGLKLGELGKIEFKRFHDEVVYYLLEKRVEIDFPYISLYLSGFLSVLARGAYDERAIEVIKLSLNRIDNYSKTLILSKYFLYFAFYFQVEKRQQQFLYRKHIKQSISKQMQLGKFFKIKLRKQGNQSQLNVVYRKLSVARRRYFEKIKGKIGK